MASLLRKQVTSKQEGETLGRKAMLTAACKFICGTVHAAVLSSIFACLINHSFCSQGEGDIFLTCE